MTSKHRDGCRKIADAVAPPEWFSFTVLGRGGSAEDVAQPGTRPKARDENSPTLSVHYS
jgi:hypothetical protein